MEVENRERQQAELDLVAAAYAPEEAWHTRRETGENDGKATKVYRRLVHKIGDNSLGWLLCLELPALYPAGDNLRVSATVEETNTTKDNLKLAYDILPKLIQSCRDIAERYSGQESVWIVLQRAEDWMAEELPSLLSQHTIDAENNSTSHILQPSNSRVDHAPKQILGRRLIYSHHIISKVKRADLKALARNYNLTGYLKIGWPGLIIIEGLDEDCNLFYDEIRPWQWQYLVMRGEMQEEVPSSESLGSYRKFRDFEEADDMSIVADACREADLEALFRTSMKVYENSNNNNNNDADSQLAMQYFGILVHVDHMNSGKAYRKWLRQNSNQFGLQILIKQIHRHDNLSSRPIHVVGLVGTDAASISSFMKQWRTQRVDVDSQGKPCLERMMKIVFEGALSREPSSRVDWQAASSEDALVVTVEEFRRLLTLVGGEDWQSVSFE
jgi:Protein of unknown function (DUF1115)